MTLSLPVEAPKVFDVAYEAAKLGVGCLVVKENAQISLEQWAYSRLLTLNWVEKPLLEGLNFSLKRSSLSLISVMVMMPLLFHRIRRIWNHF